MKGFPVLVLSKLANLLDDASISSVGRSSKYNMSICYFKAINVLCWDDPMSILTIDQMGEVVKDPWLMYQIARLSFLAKTKEKQTPHKHNLPLTLDMYLEYAWIKPNESLIKSMDVWDYGWFNMFFKNDLGKLTAAINMSNPIIYFRHRHLQENMLQYSIFLLRAMAVYNDRIEDYGKDFIILCDVLETFRDAPRYLKDALFRYIDVYEYSNQNPAFFNPKIFSLINSILNDEDAMCLTLLSSFLVCPQATSKIDCILDQNPSCAEKWKKKCEDYCDNYLDPGNYDWDIAEPIWVMCEWDRTKSWAVPTVLEHCESALKFAKEKDDLSDVRKFMNKYK